MKRSLFTFILIVLMLGLITSLALAGWADKITGGGQAMAGGTQFSITVSAWDDGSGGVAGQMEYSRTSLSMHASVECVGLFNEGTVGVAAGPVRFQEGSMAGDWMVVEILEGGVGSGDRVRVRVMSIDAALGVCGKPSGTFPGTIYDGNFNLRSR